MAQFNAKDASGSTVPVAVDTILGIDWQYVKIAVGDDGSAAAVSAANPMPISDAAGSITVDGAVTVSSSPAASRNTDSISAALAVDALMNGVTAVAPLWQPIIASASGATTLVAAVGGKKIVVNNYVLIANGTVNVKFQSHTTPTDISGLLYLGAGGGASSGFSPVGHFGTNTGEALDINLSGAVAVGGHLTYVLI